MGAAFWEEAPMVCAKLVMGPLFGRDAAIPAFPIGTPPPNAQVAPLLAVVNVSASNSFVALPRHQV